VKSLPGESRTVGSLGAVTDFKKPGFCGTGAIAALRNRGSVGERGDRHKILPESRFLS
jgi:hypothetical protein